MKHSRLARGLVGLVVIGVTTGVLVVGSFGSPTGVPTTNAASADFVEPFDSASSMGRFRFQIHHAPPFDGSPDTWQGDHDAACGAPTTTRTIHVPPEGFDAGEAAYWCAPKGVGSGHMMTSFKTTGYAQVGFSPNQVFDHVGRVCWDQNQTDLGSRKWTQVVVVPESTYQSNGQRLDYVKPSIEDGPGASGVRLTDGVFMLVMTTGSTVTHYGRSAADEDFQGFTTEDKARRFKTCINDLENGTVQIELERESTTEVRVQRGSFPEGPVRVIFQDDTYNSEKDPTSVPDPFTWHWDNIVVSATPSAGSPPATPSQSGQFEPIPPARLLDTRPGGATVDGTSRGVGERPSGTVTRVQVAGRGGVPASVKATVLNVTVDNASGAGYATVYSCGDGSPPNASNLNYRRGDTIANAVVSKLDSSGAVCIYNEGAAQILLDVNGAFLPVAGIQPLTPARLFDSRSDGTTVDGQFARGGVRAAGTVTPIQVAGRGGVPSGASAVVLNVTAVNAQVGGYATLYACDTDPPNASNLNYKTGDTIANAVLTKLDAQGRVCLFTSTPTDVLIDVNGSFPSGAGFGALTPARLFDSRPDGTTIDGQFSRAGLRDGGSVTRVQVAGRGGVPADAGAVVLNVTAVDALAAGYVTVYGCAESSPPNASNLNYRSGGTVAGTVIADVGPDGSVCVYLYGAAHLLVDVNGWFSN